jgi:hypothetical protein
VGEKSEDIDPHSYIDKHHTLLGNRCRLVMASFPDKKTKNDTTDSFLIAILFLHTNISRLTMTGETANIFGYNYDNLLSDLYALCPNSIPEISKQYEHFRLQIVRRGLVRI